VRKATYGLKRNMSQNRLLKWYSAIDELLEMKRMEGSMDEEKPDEEAIPVKAANEYGKEEYMLNATE